MVSISARSQRTQAPETTLLYARQLATTAGISEVKDISNLDVLGVPVYMSVRPQALADKITFGKGLNSIDAEVGAYMEALEFFFAEPGRSSVATRWATAREVSGGKYCEDAILNFVPLLQREIDLDGPLLLGTVRDIESNKEATIPAELIHYPARNTGQSIFGSSTNGLASGNTVLEATVQALLELIERDIWSLEFVRSESKLVEIGSLPDEVLGIVERAERYGLQLKIRTVLNEYGMPFFVAFVFDFENPSRKTFNGGWACDLDRNRGLVRAVTEAAQSRVAFIHGGRRPNLTSGRSIKALRRHMLAVSDSHDQVSLTEIPDLPVEGTLQDKLDEVIRRLRRVVHEPIYRVEFTAPESQLQIVRLVVPLLEDLKENRVRVGPRLKRVIDSLSVQPGQWPDC
jgi:ribosomal protein S12 methylthiotransferase accessory factor